jgi:hypothetical protein
MRNIELVASLSGSAGIGPIQELSTVRDLKGLAWLGARQGIEPEAWKPGPNERRGNVVQR